VREKEKEMMDIQAGRQFKLTGQEECDFGENCLKFVPTNAKSPLPLCRFRFGRESNRKRRRNE
jgi:hypothetical protein